MEVFDIQEEKIKSRREKVKDGFYDASTDEAIEAGKEIIHVFVQEIKNSIINRYYSSKSNSDADIKLELNKLEQYISISNENVDIGMSKKELAVMWAMQKLSYGEEEIQQILDLANEAYKPQY